MRKVLVYGAGGFIVRRLTKKLKQNQLWFREVDIKHHDYIDFPADEFIKRDLRDPVFVKKVIDKSFSEVYQLAADMGGAGFIFSGESC